MRTLVLVMAAMLFWAPQLPAEQCLHGASESSGEAARREQAVWAARVINSIQANHRRSYGTYVDLDGLATSPEAPSGEGPFAEAFRAMTLGAGSEVLPGFELHVTASPESYAFSIRDARDPCGFALFSDRRGVIYQGQPLGVVVAERRGQ
jgi:hypothetical protein